MGMCSAGHLKMFKMVKFIVNVFYHHFKKTNLSQTRRICEAGLTQGLPKCPPQTKRSAPLTVGSAYG